MGGVLRQRPGGNSKMEKWPTKTVCHAQGHKTRKNVANIRAKNTRYILKQKGEKGEHRG